MSGRWIACGVLLVVGLWSAPVTGALPLEERFAAAAAAYDAEDFTEAIRLYQQIRRDGFRAPALYFNLANAYYRQGDVGQAILHYAKAQYLLPRDADIRGNLQFVLNDADAVYLPPTGWTRVWRWFTHTEWRALALAAWWLTMVGLCLKLWRRNNHYLLWATTVTTALWIVALMGVRYWGGLNDRPEVVVMQAGQEALFAPLAGSTPHFALPKGSIARVNSTTDGWYRVRVGDRDGWIRQSAVAAINPLE